MTPPAISSSSALLLFLPFFFSTFIFFFSPDRSAAAAAPELVSREFFPMEGDLAWVIQVSDLHLSAYHPERAEDLARLLGSAIRVIRPDLLLVTGDITDAKNRQRTSTRQDESEWIQYRTTMDSLVKQSGIERRRIFDIRGNHDKYGVPYVGSALDFFSIHSVSSQFNRLATIQSISLVVQVTGRQFTACWVHRLFEYTAISGHLLFRRARLALGDSFLLGPSLAPQLAFSACWYMSPRLFLRVAGVSSRPFLRASGVPLRPFLRAAGRLSGSFSEQ